MTRARVREHAELMVDWAVDVQAGDMVTIWGTEAARELIDALHTEIGKKGAELVTVDAALDSTVGPSGEHIASFLANYEGDLETPRHLQALIEATNVFIGIGADRNMRALNHVPSDVQQERAQTMAPIMQTITKMDRAVLTPHPNDAWAQRAEMSLPEYEDFVYGTMFRDWESQDAKQERMRERLEAAEEARIVGPNTDLEMSLEGMHAINDVGKLNFPPGEVFTAPVVDSVNGEIRFDLPRMVQGKTVDGIRLTLEDGVVTDFNARRNEAALESLLQTDTGSNRIGEFGIGMNDDIDRITKHVSLDEKMGGTIHLALGRAYERTVGEDREQNQSAVHLDLIKEMSEGRLELDGEVVQEEGQFVWD